MSTKSKYICNAVTGTEIQAGKHIEFSTCDLPAKWRIEPACGEINSTLDAEYACEGHAGIVLHYKSHVDSNGFKVTCSNIVTEVV